MKSWKFMMLAGFIALVGGTLSLYHPVVTSITLEQLLGWTFIVSGSFNLISAITNRQAQWGLSVVMAVITLLFGFFFIRLPMETILSLALVITMMLIGSGVVQVTMALKQRKTPLFLPMLFSGIISISLAALVISSFPNSAQALLGLIFAFELISNGLSLIAFGWAQHKRSSNQIMT